MTINTVPNFVQKIKVKEIFGFLSLFLLIVVSVYFAPPILNQMFFLVLLLLFWISKRDYFWFALIFVVCSKPGLLFFGRPPFDIHIVPIYSFTKGFSLTFFEIFFALALLKAFTKGRVKKPLLKKPLFYLLVYLIYLFFLSFFYGTDFQIMKSSVQGFVPLTLILSFPNLVNKKSDFNKFAHLVFIMIFIIFLSQLLMLSTGKNLHTLFAAESSATRLQLEEDIENAGLLRAMPGGAMLILFSFIFSLFYIENKDYKGNKSYFYIILFFSVLETFLSATRGWIITFGIILLFYSIFVNKKKIYLALYSMLIGLLIMGSFVVLPKLKSSAEYSWERVSTVQYLMRGDVTAGRTLSRIDKRLPRVLEGVAQNPVFGWGFSKTFEEYTDAHVGIFNVILQVGIIGLLLFLFLWIYFVKMVLLGIKNSNKKSSFKNSLKVLIIAFIGLLILQFTTYSFFGFSLESDTIYFVVVFISFSEFFVKEAWREEKLIREV